MTLRPSKKIETINSIEEAVYRTSAAKPPVLCTLCGQDAQLRCPRCGRPLCSLHATNGPRRCTSCEATFSTTRHRVNAGATALGMVGVLAWIAYAVFGLRSQIDLLPALFAVFTIISLTAAVWGVVVGVARRLFLAQGDGEVMLEDAELWIAADTPGQAKRRRFSATRARRSNVAAYGSTDRGLPSVPLYQRTFGR